MPRGIKIFRVLLGLTAVLWGNAGQAADPMFEPPRQITSHPGDDFAPALSPDGSRMVFVSSRSGNLDLWVKSLAPGIQPPDRRLTFHSAEDNAPAISPDGATVAFVSHRSDPRGDLYLLPLDAGPKDAENPRLDRVTDETTADADPAWAPDGKSLYYTSTDPADRRQYIFQIELATKNRRKVTQEPGIQPAVSPDGRFLVFAAQGAEGGLRVMELASGRLRNLTSGRFMDLSPRFSPDGRRLYFTRYEDDTNRDGRLSLDDRPNLWSLGPGAGVHPRQLTDSASYDLLPAVQGGFLYFTSHRGGETDIWRLPESGRLAGLPDFSAQEERVGRLCGGQASYPCLLALGNLAQEFPGAASLPGVHYRRGRAYLEMGHPQRAEEIFRELIAAYPQDAPHRGLAEVELVRLDVEKARDAGRTAYREANRKAVERLTRLAADPAAAPEVAGRALLETGHRQVELEDFNGALASFRKVIADFPGLKPLAAEAAFSQSRVYLQVGDRARLVQAFVQVLRDYPDVPEWPERAIREILNIFEQPPILEQKVVGLQSLIQDQTDLPVLAATVQNRIGELYHLGGENLLAREAYGRTLARFSGQPGARDRAHFELARIHAEEQNFEMSLHHYGQVLAETGGLEESIREARRGTIRKLIDKGTWELNVGEVKLAAKTFLKLIDFSPETVEGHRGYIQSQAALKQVEPVIEHYRRRAAGTGAAPVDHYALGLALTYRDPPALDAASEAIGRALRDQGDVVFYHQTLGWVFEQKERAEGGRGHLEQAIQEYRTALALNDEAADPQNEANLLLNLGNSNYALNNFYSAYQYYDRRFHSGREFVNADREALFYQRYAESAFKAGFPDQAVTLYRKALEQVSRKQDVARMAELNDRIGLAYQDMGDAAHAVEAFSLGLELHRQAGSAVNFSRSLRNIANNLVTLGEQESGDGAVLNRALSHYFEAIDHLEQHGVRTRKAEGPGRGLVQVDLETGLDDDASRAAFGFDAEGERKLIFHYIGKIYGDFGDYERAIEYFGKKLAMIPADLKPEGNVPLLLEKALLLNQIGHFHYRAGRPAESREHFRRSYDVSRSIDNRKGIAVNAINLGRLLLWQARREPAASLHPRLEEGALLLEEALAALDQKDQLLGHPAHRVVLRNALGMIYFHLGWILDAAPAGPPADPRQQVARGLEDVDRGFGYVRRSLENFEAGLTLARELATPRGRNLELALAQNASLVRSFLQAPEPAPGSGAGPAHGQADWQFRYLRAIPLAGPERLAHLLAAEDLLSRRPFGAGRGPGALALQEALYRDLTRDLFRAGRQREALQYSDKGLHQSLAWALAGQPLRFESEARSTLFEEILEFSNDWIELFKVSHEEKGEAESLADAASALFQEYQDFLAAVEEEDPALAALVQPRLPDLDEVAARIQPGDVLIKWFPAPGETLAWVHSGGQWQAFRLAAPPHRNRSSALPGATAPTWSRAEIASLSRALIEPLAAHLKSARRLILIPAGDLEVLPWAALELEGRPLIDRMSLSFQSSLEQFLQSSRKRNLYTSRLLAFGLAPAAFAGLDARYASAENHDRESASVDALVSGLPRFGIVHAAESADLPALDLAGSHLNLVAGPKRYERVALRNLVQRSVEANLLAVTGVRYRAHPESDAAESALFVQGLTLAGYPGLLVAGGGGEGHAALLSDFYGAAAEGDPAEALRAAQNRWRQRDPQSTAWADFRFYGFPGMSGAEKTEFARAHFDANLNRGVEAFRASDWPGAIAYFEKALALARFLPEKNTAGQLNKTLAQAAYNAGDFRKAVGYQKRVVEQAADDPEQLAEAHYFLGILYSRAEDYPPAVASLKKALAFYQEYEILDKLAESYSTLGIVEENALDYDGALKSFTASSRINEDIGEDLNRGRELRRIGRIYYLRLSQYELAAGYFEQANALFRELGEPEQVVETWLELGLVAEKQGDFARALEFYRKAEALAGESDLRLQLSKAFLYQGNAWWFQGDYQKAFRFQKQALELARDTGDNRQEAFVQNTLGLIYWTLNDSARALEHLETSRRLAEQVHSPLDVASAYNNMGLVYRKDKAYEKSIELFQEALKRDVELKSKWAQGYTHRNLGISHLRLNRLEEAERHLAQAIALSESIGNRTNLVKAKLEWGHLALARNDCAGAVPVFRETADLARRLNIPEVTWRALRGEGLCLARSGRKADAVGVYQEAVAVVDAMRAAIKVEEFQNGFLTDKQDVYKELVLLLLDTGQIEESFHAVERARSRSFIDLLGNQKISLKNAVSQKLYDGLMARKQEIRKIEEALGRAEEEARAKELAASLVQARNAYRDLLIEAKEASPEISSFVSVDAITLDRLHPLLEKDTALVEYLVTPRELVAWVVGKGSIRVVRTPVEETVLAEAIRDYRERMQKMAPLEEQSVRLYDWVLRPVADLLAPFRVIGIVPHGHLHYLSFASLNDGAAFWLERHPLFYTPSASVLEYTFKRQYAKQGPVKVLALGNPDLGSFNYDLPLAELEAKSIRWEYPQVTVLTRNEARESWLREHIHEYQIIHIASHGEFDPVNPLFSSLKLTRDDAADGNFEVNEVFSLNINADLVTLSACQTGLGDIVGGDELVGLNRAFIYAGTHAIVSSLWRVSDISTAVLIKHFYRNYTQRNKGESLRAAQLSVRKLYPHPAYWAGFSLTGDYR